jgi:lysophospholipase L1-like esterase
MFAELHDATRFVFASGLATEVDATSAFDHEQRPVYQEDGVHYTALGNRLVADAVAPKLAQATCGN